MFFKNDQINISTYPHMCVRLNKKGKYYQQRRYFHSNPLHAVLNTTLFETSIEPMDRIPRSQLQDKEKKTFLTEILTDM